VPACRTLDCVTVFARHLGTAERAMAIMAGPQPARPWPASAPLAAPPRPRVAVAGPEDLAELTAEGQAAFAAAAARLPAAGAELVTIDLAPFRAASRLLYEGGVRRGAARRRRPVRRRSPR
jgi:allophanate hydrolase